MAATNDARVDTTFIGYLLIGFVLLMFGVLGLQDGALFGDVNFYAEGYDYSKLPIDYDVFAQVCGLIAILLLVLMIFAYRTGKGPAAAIFAFTAIALLCYSYCEYTESWVDALTGNSCWFLYIALAIFFLIFVVYAMVGKAPKFVSVLLFLMALMFFFFALNDFYCYCGPSPDYDLYKAMGIVYGIFGFLGFIVATYLGLAYANPKRIPVI